MNNSNIGIKANGVIKLIPFEQINFIKAEDKYSIVVTIDDKRLYTSLPIKDYLEILPPKNFLRIHHNCVINTLFIDSISIKNEMFALMANGHQLEISRRKLKDIKSALARLIVI